MKVYDPATGDPDITPAGDNVSPVGSPPAVTAYTNAFIAANVTVAATPAARDIVVAVVVHVTVVLIRVAAGPVEDSWALETCPSDIA